MAEEENKAIKAPAGQGMKKCGLQRSKIFIRIFCVLFMAISTLSYGQESKEKSQTKQEKVGEGFDLFENVEEAPVSYKGAFVKMMLTLLGLVALIVLSVWMLRRVSHSRIKQMNTGRSIKILERRPLSAKSALYLIDIDGKKVVVSESQLEVRPITGGEHFGSDLD